MINRASRTAIVIACVVGLTIAAGCGKSESSGGAKSDANVVKREGNPDFIRVDDSGLMGRAIAKARETQSQFVDALSARKPGHTGFAIKKGFPVEGGGLEHIWVNEVTWDGSAFIGRINNEPVDTTAVKIGDEVKVTPEELSDWMYLDGKTLAGGYTVRVLHYQSPPEQQAEFVKQTGMIVPPIDF